MAERTPADRAVSGGRAAGPSTLGGLEQVTRRLWQAPGLQAGIEEMLAAALELTGAAMASLHLVTDPDGPAGLAAVAGGLPDDLADSLRTVQAGDGTPHGRALAAQEAIGTVIAAPAPHAGASPTGTVFTDLAATAGIGAVSCIPLVAPDGTPIGILSLYRLRTDAGTTDGTTDRTAALDIYLRLATAFLAHARADEQLRRRDESLSLALDLSWGGTFDIDMSDMKVALDGRARSPFFPDPARRDRLQDVLAWVPDEDRAKLLAVFAEMRRDPGYDRGEIEFRAGQPDGSTRWLHGVARAYRDTSGRLLRVAGTVIDITERKRRELEALESSSKLEAALAAMSDAVVLLDNAGRILHFNEAFVRFCRFDSGEELLAALADQPSLLEIERAGGERLTSDRRDISRALRGADASHDECVIRRRDTGESWVGSVNYAPVRGRTGALIGAVISGRDVTERRHTERRLVESEARLSSIIDTAAEGIVVIDEQGLIQSANRAAREMFGYETAELIGRNVSVLMALRGHDDYLEAYRRTGVRRLIGSTREAEARRCDGSLFPIDISVAEWFDGDGRRFFTGLVRDISERKRTEEALALSRRLEAVGQLAAGVAHDFNNLLTVISGNLELIEDRVDDERSRQLVRRALDAVEVGASFNRRLLSLARRRALEPRRVMLDERISDVVQLLTRTLGEHIEISTETVPGLWATVADPGEIDSALLNLVMNARDALTGGGRIVVRAENDRLDGTAPHIDVPAGEYVCLSVIDSGTGMEPEVLDRALEPFFTTKAAGAGSGLGLSTVASFARQSGGALTIDSSPGQGTTVRLHLPRHDDEVGGGRDGEARRRDPGDTARPVPAAGEAPTGGPGGPAVDGRLVLVVEDDDALREMTVDRLRTQGYGVLEARSGVEAVELLAGDERIGVVLSDIVMPGGMTGFEVAQWVADHKPGVGVVLTSGYSEQARPPDANGLLERTPYLAKPYTGEMLANAITALLAGPAGAAEVPAPTDGP